MISFAQQGVTTVVENEGPLKFATYIQGRGGAIFNSVFDKYKFVMISNLFDNNKPGVPWWRARGRAGPL